MMEEPIKKSISPELVVPLEVYQRGSRVGGSATLSDIRFHNIGASLKRFKVPKKMRPTVQVDVSSSPVTASGSFVVMAEYSVNIYDHSEDANDDHRQRDGYGEETPRGSDSAEASVENLIASIEVSVAALYRTQGLPDDVAEDEVESFAMSGGLLALHPYAREAVASSLQRLGLPSYQMRTIKIITNVAD